jgi:bacteriocin biosynthesis cyclodehydratase domain-containing protein
MANEPTPALDDASARRPCLAPWLAPIELNDTLALLCGDRLVELRGPRELTDGLLDELDGTRTELELLADLPPERRPAVVRALDALRRAAVLIDGPPLPADLDTDARDTVLAIAAVQPITPAPAAVAARLADAAVAVVGAGRAGARADAALGPAGLGRVERHPTGVVHGVDLVIAAPTAADRVSLRDRNAEYLASGQVWLPVVPFDGARVQVGPLIVPGSTACFECALLRRAGAVEFSADYEAVFTSESVAPTPECIDALAGALAAAVALGWLGCADPRLPGQARVIDVSRLDVSRAGVLRVPRCRACAPSHRVGAPYPWFHGG